MTQPSDSLRTAAERPIDRRTGLVRLALGALGIGLGPLAAALPSALRAAELPVSIPIDQARRAVEAGQATIVDVREPDETAAGVVPGARLLPSGQIAPRAGELPRDGRPVLLICRTANRSKAAAQALRAQGYDQVQYVEGGMSEWLKRGWPTAQPPATRSAQ